VDWFTEAACAVCFLETAVWETNRAFNAQLALLAKPLGQAAQASWASLPAWASAAQPAAQASFKSIA
jgi:hypothetical protein